MSWYGMEVGSKVTGRVVSSRNDQVWVQGWEQNVVGNNSLLEVKGGHKGSLFITFRKPTNR